MFRLRFAMLTASALALAISTAGAQGLRTEIPPGQMPPAGLCRVWIDGVPSGRQPRATDCASARAHAPANSRIIYGGESQGRVSLDPRAGTLQGRYDPRADPRSPSYDPRYDPNSRQFDPRYGTNNDNNNGAYDPRYGTNGRNGNFDPRHSDKDREKWERKREKEHEKEARKEEKRWNKHRNHDSDRDDR